MQCPCPTCDRTGTVAVTVVLAALAPTPLSSEARSPALPSPMLPRPHRPLRRSRFPARRDDRRPSAPAKRSPSNRTERGRPFSRSCPTCTRSESRGMRPRQRPCSWPRCSGRRLRSVLHHSVLHHPDFSSLLLPSANGPGLRLGAVPVGVTLTAWRGRVSCHSHPFCGSGTEFAHEHVVVLAQTGVIGPVQSGGLHVPGVHHGFAVCLDIYP